MATRGALGGLSEATLQAALLMDAVGKDDVFLETVGVGQAEVDIIDHADTIVLVLMPGSGDSIQALKAGVMEIPDIIVVNKSDHPLTDTMVREIRGVLSLGAAGGLARADRQDRGGPRHRRRGAGRELDEHRAHIEAEGTLSERRRRNLRNEVLGLATVRLRRRARGVPQEDEVRRACSTRWSSAGSTRQARRADPLARGGDRDPRGRALMKPSSRVWCSWRDRHRGPIDDDRPPGRQARAATPADAGPDAGRRKRRDVRRARCPADVPAPRGARHRGLRRAGRP